MIRSRYTVRMLIVGMWLALASLTFLPRGSAASTNFSYDDKVTYRVDGSGNTTVTENYTVVNNTGQFYLTELRLSTATETITGLSAKYADGGVISTTSDKKSAARGDVKYSYQEIHLVFPRQIYGLRKSWSFSVSYQTGALVDTKGGAHTVYVPAIDAREPDDGYSVTVDVPRDFGNPHFTGAQSSGGGYTDGRQVYNFEKSALLDHALALAFGDSTVYQLNFNFPLKNPGPLPKTLTVTLPPDLNNQHSFVSKLDPQPANTHLDADGNVLAEYHLRPHQTINVKTDVSGQVNYLDYDLSASAKKSDIPADLINQYTKPTHNWPTDGEVAEQAKKLVDPNAPVVNNVKAIYSFVIDKLSYNPEKIKLNFRQGAAQALKNPTNVVCLEYADLTIAMLRSVGIPARMPVGYGYSGSLKNSSSVVDSLHAWVEAYVPGVGWMTLDPTWGEKFDEFGHSDLDHFAFAVWGKDDEAPGATMLGSRDLGYQYEAATIAYQPTAPKPGASGALSVTHFVLLPFVSLDRFNATAPALAATDRNRIEVNGQSLELGSLAPSQKVGFFKLTLGGGWNRPTEAKLARQSKEQALILSTTHAKTSYLPMFGLMALVAASVIWALVLRLRPKVKPDKVDHPNVREVEIE